MKQRLKSERQPREKLITPAKFSLILFSLDLSDTNSRAEWENSLELIASIDSVCGEFLC